MLLLQQEEQLRTQGPAKVEVWLADDYETPAAGAAQVGAAAAAAAAAAAPAAAAAAAGEAKGWRAAACVAAAWAALLPRLLISQRKLLPSVITSVQALCGCNGKQSSTPKVELEAANFAKDVLRTLRIGGFAAPGPRCRGPRRLQQQHHPASFCCCCCFYHCCCRRYVACCAAAAASYRQQQQARGPVSGFLQQLLQLLHYAKKRRAAEELYLSAERIRLATLKVTQAIPKVQALEAKKKVAVAKDDFAAAAVLQQQLHAIASLVRRTVAAGLLLQDDMNPLSPSDEELTEEQLLRCLNATLPSFEMDERPGGPSCVSRVSPPAEAAAAADLKGDTCISGVYAPLLPLNSPSKRAEGLTAMRQRLQHEAELQGHHKANFLASEDFLGSFVVALRFAFADKTLKVLLVAFQILTALTDQQGVPQAFFTSAAFMEVLDSLCLCVSGAFSERAQQLLLRLCMRRPLGGPICTRGFAYLATTVAAEQQELEQHAAAAGAAAADASAYTQDTCRRHGVALRNRRRLVWLSLLQHIYSTYGVQGDGGPAAASMQPHIQVLKSLSVLGSPEVKAASAALAACMAAPSNKQQVLPPPHQSVSCNKHALPVCIFCLHRSASLKGSGLDKHFAEACPCLTRCTNCGVVLEMSGLDRHLLSECGTTASYSRCPRFNKVDFSAEVAKHTDCSPPPTAERGYCHYCGEAVGPSQDDWRQHLTQTCCTNPLMQQQQQQQQQEVQQQEQPRPHTDGYEQQP
ncbi:hypothetical protein Esti_003474 [Eimeria stiedai]